MKKNYLPVQFDISQGKILLVGGGRIAFRKLMYIKDFGGDVVCIAPDVIPEIKAMAERGEIGLIEREFKEGDAAGYKLVFAATNNPDADKLIYEDCQKSGALLNVADVPEYCSFILPAYVKKGEITFSISSGGAAPFYVKHLKSLINDNLPSHFDDIVKLATLFREKLVRDARYKNENSRNELINRFLNVDWEEFLEKNDFDSAVEKVNSLL